MQFNKSYSLLRFLNRKHSAVMRYFLGSCAWVVILVIARSMSLAALIFNEFVIDDYRLAFRRSGWFARHVWPKLDFFNDPYFDFTMETTPCQRRQLAKFVDRSCSSMSRPVYLTDQLYILAADIHGNLEEHQAGYYPSDKIRKFYSTADQVLSCLAVAPCSNENKTPNRKCDFSKVDATKALEDFSTALALDDWPWYVVSGTFLGLQREGGFLAHDYDIDLGINAEEVSVDQLLRKLDTLPHFITKKIDKHIEIRLDEFGLLRLFRVPALVKLVHSNGLNLDVFIHYTENGRCWHGSIIHRWENTPFELERRTLGGIAVNAPVNADLYLTENYGNWQTPVKDFDCTTGTPNLIVSRNFLSVALFLKRLAVFSETDGLQAEKLTKMLVVSGVIERVNKKLKIVRSFELLRKNGPGAKI